MILLCLILLSFPSFAQVKITMEKEAGVYTVPCKVNGLPLKFIFDTGASDVVISLSEALFMLKNGYLKPEDLKGSSYSQIANGDIVENTTVILKEIEVGGMKIYNTTGRISHSLEAPLLLGQSALQKLGTIQINGNVLTISNGKVLKFDYTGFARNIYKSSDIVKGNLLTFKEINSYEDLFDLGSVHFNRIAITQQYTIIEVIYNKGKFSNEEVFISKDAVIIYEDRQGKGRYAKIIKSEGIAMEPNTTKIEKDNLRFRLYFPKISLKNYSTISLYNNDSFISFI